MPVRHPVVVVGAGPAGLTAALDLAQRGVPVVLLDDADRIGEGSRGICWAKRGLLGSSASSSSRMIPSIRLTCCRKMGSRCPPSSTCNNISSSMCWLSG